MKRLILVSLLICVMCITACDKTDEKLINKNQAEDRIVKQKITFIYHFTNRSEESVDEGFYINSKGNRIEYDISEVISERGIHQDKYDFTDMYEIILEYAEHNEDIGEEWLSEEDVLKCYKLLIEIGDDYQIESKSSGGADMGSSCWYGIIDDYKNEHKIILLSEMGDWESYNSNKNAQEILNILSK